MGVTPWGRVEELRSRKLTPGPGRTREEVARNQRERLLAATVAAVAEKGYEAARVQDVLDLSGVSRNTFYNHFANKHDCVVATIDELLGQFERTVEDAHRSTPGTGEHRLEAALRALADAIVAQPMAARVSYVDVYATGADGLARLDRVDARLERMVRAALSESPPHAHMPRELVRAILGGLRKVIHTRLREGREAELPALVPDLLRWASSYRTPPQRLRRPRKVPEHLAARRREPGGDARQRMLHAVADLAAERGYAAMAVTDIAERASVSLTTFYEHFDTKQDAFLATLADAQQRVLEATLAAFRHEADWATAVAEASHRFLGFLATEPAVAQVGGVAAWSAAPAALDMRAEGLAAFGQLLVEGYREYPDTLPIAREAIGASLDAYLFGRLDRHGPERLYELAPTGTFIVLVPFVGVERACELANRAPGT